METSFEIQENNLVNFTVTVEASEVDARLAATYKKFAQQYNFPGFRKGKAPRAVIDNAFGAQAVPASVTEDLINETAPVAVDESGIVPVGEPNFGDDAIIAVPGKDLVYSFTIQQRNDLTLSSYEPVEIEVPSEEVSDEEFNDQVASFLESYTTYEDAADGAKIESENRVDFNMKATNDKDEELALLTSESFPYVIGSGLFPASFDEKVMGASVGDSLEFEIAMPEESCAYTSSYEGKTESLKFKLEVKSIQIGNKPEITDEWVEENLGFESATEFNDRLREMLKEQKSNAIPRMKENAALQVLISRLEGEVPENMVEESETNLLQDFFKQLQAQGMTFDSYLNQTGLTSETFKEDLKKQAKDMASEELALTAWAKHFEITASPEEVSAEFVNSGAENPAELEENWRKAGRLHMVREGIMRAKALEDVIAKANITEIK